MTKNLIEILNHFRGNRDRAAEEGRFRDELPNLYANAVKRETNWNLFLQYDALREATPGSTVFSYIGATNGKCYLLAPVYHTKDSNNLSNELGNFLIKAIEKGKMQIGNCSCMKISGALKQTGTTIDVDNDAPVSNVDTNLKVDFKEKGKYIVFEISSPTYNAIQVKDFLYKKLNTLQPQTLKEKDIAYRVENINSEELGIFLTD